MDTCAKNSVRGLSLILFVLLTAIVLSALPGSSRAAVINVPDDQPSIQDAIVAANFFDTVMVAPGRYFENIDFLGKWIVVTSRFALNYDPSYIFSTIIDGSQPVHPDSASCVRMVTNENNFSILQGFTLTGGTGTNWVDEHGAGTFREGGGILMTSSSPIIQYNYVVDNEAVYVPSGLVSAGGGGIRIGDGDPLIQNNIIIHNRGRYGAGIVLNYCQGTIRNNVIAYNTGGEDYGGGGIWKNPGTSIVENNTIVGNISATGGGGVYIYSSGTITLHNNIIWGNVPNQAYQTFGGSFSASYNDIQNGGLAGTGNIDMDPALIGEFLYLTAGSPCTDAGDPGVAFNDPEDPSALGNAIWPATGTLTNDMGAYGGPLSFTFEPVSFFADTTIGWAPLEVAFTPIYGYTVNSWSWDFGDGDGSTVENPVHTFTTGGQYDVSLDAGTDTGTKSRIKTKYISILADTLIGIDAEGDAGGDVEVTVNARNNVPVSKIRLPFEYGGGDFNLTFDSFSTAGCRTAAFDTVAHVFADVFGHRDVLSIYNYNTSTPNLEAGYGPIIKLYFSMPNPASGSVTLTYDGFMSYLPTFFSPLLTYNPVVNTSTVSTSYLCGDASGDGDVNLIDILYLISYIYDVPPGPEPMPLAAGDANGDGAINLIDILYLIDYRYGSPPGPDPLCP